MLGALPPCQPSRFPTKRNVQDLKKESQSLLKNLLFYTGLVNT